MHRPGILGQLDFQSLLNIEAHPAEFLVLIHRTHAATADLAEDAANWKPSADGFGSA